MKRFIMLIVLAKCSMWVYGDQISNPEEADAYLAILQINDQATLINIVKNSTNEWMREHAIRKISDQKFLLETALNDRNVEVSRLAVNGARRLPIGDAHLPAPGGLNDRAVLEKIAKNVTLDHRVRRAALERLQFRKYRIDRIAADIAENDHDRELRWYAIEILNGKNQSLLIKIANNDTDNKIRGWAVYFLTEQKRIAEFAKNDRDEYVRGMAIRKLEDQELLEWILKNDESDGVRESVVFRLKNQALLAEIAKNNKNTKGMRLLAIQQLKDQAALTEIAKNEKDESLRARAVEFLGDKKLLEKFAKNDESEKVREAAENNLKNGWYKFQL